MMNPPSDAQKLPKNILAAITAMVATLLILIVYNWNIQSNLRSTTKITQHLREELEVLRKENQGYRDRDSQESSQIETLNAELSSLRQDRSMSASKEDDLKKLVDKAESTLTAQNMKIAELENKLREYEERMRRQKKASANLEQQTRSAKANPGMTQEYVRLVENEWMSAVSKTEELKVDLDKTLEQLSAHNRDRMRLRDETATMHYNLAVILAEQGNHRAAILEYEKVLESRPNDADAHYNLGILYDEVYKNNEKALDHYRQFIRVAPDSTEASKVRGWIKDKELDTTMKMKV